MQQRLRRIYERTTSTSHHHRCVTHAREAEIVSTAAVLNNTTGNTSAIAVNYIIQDNDKQDFLSSANILEFSWELGTFRV